MASGEHSAISLKLSSLCRAISSACLRSVISRVGETENVAEGLVDKLNTPVVAQHQNPLGQAARNGLVAL